MLFFSLVLLGVGTAYAANDATTPMQIRLAYAGSNGMHVSWNTYDQLSQPTVYYGLTPYLLNFVARSDVSVTYPTSTTFNNHVKLENLLPDTQYYYKPQYSNASAPLSFRTSRLAGDAEPFTVALAVDLGTMGADGLTTYTGKGAANPLAPGERNTIEALDDTKSEFDFLWQPGDLAYADYWLKEEIGGFLPNMSIADGYKVYERILNEFYDQMSPISSLKPYMVGPGNHEANCDNGGTKDKAHGISYNVSICMPGQTNFTGYRNHFRMPSDESGGLENFWYSFDHGMVHFITLDTETDLGHGYIAPDEPGGSGNENSGPFASVRDQQTEWLMNDLASVDRSKTPWVVVGLHRPWYVNQPNASLCISCQNVFEPIFNNYSVDLVVTGHVHAYQRNAPVFQGQADPAELNNPKYPWYITNGAAGHYDGLDSLTRPFTNYTRAAFDSVYGWSRLVFHNATHLTQEFVASGNGSVLDSATLYKERNATAVGLPPLSLPTISLPSISLPSIALPTIALPSLPPLPLPTLPIGFRKVRKNL